MEKDTRQRDNKSLALIVKIENGRLVGVNSYQKSTQDLYFILISLENMTSVIKILFSPQ
jgi:hypothetical protein